MCCVLSCILPFLLSRASEVDFHVSVTHTQSGETTCVEPHSAGHRDPRHSPWSPILALLPPKLGEQLFLEDSELGAHSQSAYAEPRTSPKPLKIYPIPGDHPEPSLCPLRQCNSSSPSKASSGLFPPQDAHVWWWWVECWGPGGKLSLGGFPEAETFLVTKATAAQEPV